MSPLSKKREHHDLRILRFERTASTAAVRTRGDFGIIPSPLSRCCQQYESRKPAGSTSIMIVRAKLTAVPKIQRGVYLPTKQVLPPHSIQNMMGNENHKHSGTEILVGGMY